ncbi:MAG: M16 family metallopeptidase, partial [Planctomycetota bacterium]
MNASILSHTFSNGLVLVAEPLPSLESAAFTFLVPAGCVYDPTDRGGLSGFTCEMALRGAGPRDNRRFVLDLDNLGVERHESVSAAHAGFSGATVAENLPNALAIYADMLLRARLPADQLEASRLVMLQELRAVEDEPAQKVMIELRRRHYPEPWGRPAQGEQQALQSVTIDDVRPHFQQQYRPN